jgi:signal transduction histidine kinase
VARIISGKMRLEPRFLDVTTVVQSAIDAGRPAADAKGIALTATLEPVPSTLADALRLAALLAG